MATLTRARLPIEQVKPNPNNPRKISGPAFERLVKSLQDCPDLFEARELLCSDRTGETICLGGNMRLKAAARLGYKAVPVVILHGLTEKQEREIVLRDNGSFGEWDFLALEDWKDLPLAELGVDLPAGFFDTLDQAPQVEPAGHTDRAAELQVKWGTALGQAWRMGPHRIVCGDSTDPGTIARLMAGEQAQLVYTDPPYDVTYEDAAGNRIKNDGLRQDELSTFLERALKNLGPATKPTAAFYIWHASATRRDFEWAMNAAGLVEKQYLTWVKEAFVLGRADYHWQTEPCFYAEKAGNTADYMGDRSQSTVWRITIDRNPGGAFQIANGVTLSNGSGDVLFIRETKPKATKSRHVRLAEGETLALLATRATTAWQISRESKSDYFHPTQKPVELAEIAIRNSSRPGDIVLDIFSGSASTLLACERLSRRCRAVELDPKYVAVALERWSELTGAKPELEQP